MDVPIHDICCDSKVCGNVDEVEHGENMPWRSRRFHHLVHRSSRRLAIVTLFGISNGFFGLASGEPFDYVGQKKMAWNQEEEDGTEDEILTPVVMTRDADEDTILESVSMLTLAMRVSKIPCGNSQS